MKLLAHGSWGVHGAALPDDAPPLAAGFHPAPDPVRPAEIEASTWRRMSRLARLAAAATAPVLPAVHDRTTLPLLWGTLYGEYATTFAFLRSLVTRGPAGASPLLFQNAVHNAPAGHLSIAYGLQGPSETLCAGGLTAFRALERASVLVELQGGPVLVVVGDELTADVQRGLAEAGAEGPWAEGAVALLVGPGDGLDWTDAPCDWHRAQTLPGEPPFVATGRAPELRFGLGAATDAFAVVASVGRGGVVGFGGLRLRVTA